MATTIPVTLADFVGQHYVDYGIICAGGIIASIIPVMLGFFFSRYIVKGLTSGSVKA